MTNLNNGIPQINVNFHVELRLCEHQRETLERHISKWLLTTVPVRSRHLCPQIVYLKVKFKNVLMQIRMLGNNFRNG